MTLRCNAHFAEVSEETAYTVAASLSAGVHVWQGELDAMRSRAEAAEEGQKVLASQVQTAQSECTAASIWYKAVCTWFECTQLRNLS